MIEKCYLCVKNDLTGDSWHTFFCCDDLSSSETRLLVDSLVSEREENGRRGEFRILHESDASENPVQHLRARTSWGDLVKWAKNFNPSFGLDCPLAPHEVPDNSWNCLSGGDFNFHVAELYWRACDFAKQVREMKPAQKPCNVSSVDSESDKNLDAIPTGRFQAWDVDSDSDKPFVFDATGATHWGPRTDEEEWLPIDGFFAIQVDRVLYQHETGHWTLISWKTHYEFGKLDPEARRLNDAEAADWLVRNGYDAPPELAYLVADVFFTPGRPVEKGTAESNKNEPLKPSWDGERRELSFAGEICKAFKQPAPNQTRILETFEESGWPARIDDPISPLPGSVQRQRLADAVRGLKKNGVIHFELDGTGEGVVWDPPADERAAIEP